MDMKKILQAVDGASSKKPVEGSNDMKNFMQIVEGKGPLNRLTAAESIAVNYYSNQEPRKNITSPVLNVPLGAKPGMIGKYFKSVEQEMSESAERTKERAKELAEIVSSKLNEGVPRLSKHISQSKLPPDALNRRAKHFASKRLKYSEETEGVDSVTLDVPLMIRLLEYSREDASNDMDLHNIAERLIELSQKVDVISMEHYDAIVTGEIDESLRTENPCWKGYKPVGTKKKGGRTVPNCVPKE